MPYARWPFELLYVELAAYYCLAGVSKLRASGIEWADGYTLQYYLLIKGAPLGEWLASHLWACAALSALVLIFEVGFPLGIVLRRLRALWLTAGLFFHLGTTYFMNITFFPVVALYAVFVPWAALGRGRFSTRK